MSILLVISATKEWETTTTTCLTPCRPCRPNRRNWPHIPRKSSVKEALVSSETTAFGHRRVHHRRRHRRLRPRKSFGLSWFYSRTKRTKSVSVSCCKRNSWNSTDCHLHRTDHRHLWPHTSTRPRPVTQSRCLCTSKVRRKTVNCLRCSSDRRINAFGRTLYRRRTTSGRFFLYTPGRRLLCWSYSVVNSRNRDLGRLDLTSRLNKSASFSNAHPSAVQPARSNTSLATSSALRPRRFRWRQSFSYLVLRVYLFVEDRWGVGRKREKEYSASARRRRRRRRRRSKHILIRGERRPKMSFQKSSSVSHDRYKNDKENNKKKMSLDVSPLGRCSKRWSRALFSLTRIIFQLSGDHVVA